MKKIRMKSRKEKEGDLLPEYDFTGKKGVRGKYYHQYQQGHTVKILKENGTTEIRYFTLEEGAVVLEPDVREYFPDSEKVNTVLRSLIALIPHKATRRKAASKSQ